MGKPGRFRFSLARVLSVRETELSLEKQRVAAANARLREARVQLAEANEARDEGAAFLASLRESARIDIGACLGAEQAIDLASRRISACEKRVGERQIESQTALDAYTEANKNVKSLERLRELRHSEHAQARRAEESKTLDEVAANRSHAALTRSNPT